MKKKTIKRIIIILVLAALLLFSLKRCGILGDGAITKVAVDTAQQRNIIEIVTASGKIYPETEVKIKPDVSGEIVELHIAEGDSVQKGQLLLKINPSIYSSAVTQAEATMNQSRSGVMNAQELVAQSKAQMDRAKANYERNKKLYEDKIISRLEYEQFETEYLTAKAGYEAARANVSGGTYGVTGALANLSQARENLRRTSITAPNAGIVSQLLVKKGERVVGTAQMDGTQILTIADLGRMEVRVDVSETDISKVSLNDTAIITVDAYRNRKFKGIVTKIAVSSVSDNALVAASSNTEVTNYTVHILILPETYASLRTELGKGKFPFKPGMSAGVEIQTRRENDVLSVPLIAVTTRDWPDSLKTKKTATSEDDFKDFRQVVFVYDKNTQSVVLRDVSTGVQDNEFIQILSGLKKGDIVVSAPYNVVARQLESGNKVNVVDKKQLWEDKEEPE
jgi:HlyD family secretion protein